MIINLTPHTINILNNDKSIIISIPSTGQARCETKRIQFATEENIPLFTTKYGDVTGLPDETPGTIIVVSLLVRQACPERGDLFSPGELVRDENGQPVGCIGLSQ